MVTHVTECPGKKARPPSILWGDYRVQTSDVIEVPPKGIVEAKLITATTVHRQGFDMKVDGWFQLSDGQKVPLLRTWNDDRFEDLVEYPFYSKDALLYVWNVYETYRGPEKVVEKWTGNAGFWVERVSARVNVYTIAAMASQIRRISRRWSTKYASVPRKVDETGWAAENSCCEAYVPPKGERRLRQPLQVPQGRCPHLVAGPDGLPVVRLRLAVHLQWVPQGVHFR